MKRIYVVGTADTKGEELAFLAEKIRALGADTLATARKGASRPRPRS